MQNVEEDGWTTILKDHPIFSCAENKQESLELSTNTLPKFTSLDPAEDSCTPSGRRQVMVLKDADIIVAVGKELRIASLGESKASHGTTKKSYKTLHTPNIQFEIHQLTLNPSGKLLAVAGAFQLAVVVLPRPGFSRLVPQTIDCKSVQVGQFYHASKTSAPIVRVEWHPWGEAGSTLLVMTIDGKMREYDISVNVEEPQQVLSFVPKRKAKSYLAEDASEREVASFTLGKGKADWGPLTMYAVMRSGDIYAICPYMPQNASIPSAYVHALECFISAKQEFLAQGNISVASRSLSTLYDYQHKYVTALLKQLPPGTVFPAASRPVLMHPPTTIKSQPVRQGPFLMQPAPRTLEGSEGGDATDITYLGFVTDDDEDKDGETERLGVILLAYQDAKVDVCLDVEKVEARWEHKQRLSKASSDLPMLAVYETIDLGLISTLKTTAAPLELLQGNHPVFHLDPIHDDIIYIYHAFGVHSLHIGPVLSSLAVALRKEDEDSLSDVLQTDVHAILSTFSVERKCSNPVVSVCVTNDVYLAYSIFILTSTMRATSFSLNPRAHSPPLQSQRPASAVNLPTILPPMPGPSAYVSLLGTDAYTPAPALVRPLGLPSNPKLALPSSPQELTDRDPKFMLTADTLRYLGTTAERLTSQIHAVQLAYREAQARAELQARELVRQQEKCHEVLSLLDKLKGPAHHTSEERLMKWKQVQKGLLGRLDRMVQVMMDKASPELSEHETRWFEELKRMKAEILGASKYDEESLAARTAALQKEYERLLPGLHALQERERSSKKKNAERSQALGVSQAFELGERSNVQRAKMTDIEKDLQRLARKLEVPLERAPERQ